MCERPADGQGHPACSVMVEGAFGRPLKQPLHGFRDDLLFIAPVVSRVNEKDSPPRSMAESHLTERKRMGIIAKWPFSRTDVLSSQYRVPECTPIDIFETLQTSPLSIAITKPICTGGL